MINQVGKKNPKRRFKEFLGEENWNVHTLGTVLMSMYNGQTPSRSKGEYWNGKINWLTSGELNCGIVNDTLEKITELGLDNANLKIIPKGILVIAITGLEASGTRGNCAILGCNTTLNQSCMALFPIRSLISSNFLFNWYLFIGDYYGIKYTQGTKQQSYNSKILNDLEIVIPSLDEQNKISSFFLKMDEMIDLQQRKLNKLQATKKALLQEMFPEEGQDKPKRRFKGFTDDWEQRKLGNLTQLITKGTTPKVKNIQNGINFIKVENISDDGVISINSYVSEEEHMNYLSRSILSNDDILFSIAGTLGRTAIVKSHLLPANTNQALAIIRLNKSVDVEYINTFLKSNAIKTYIRKNPTVGAQPNLSLGQVSDLEINIPSYSEQKKISNLFSKFDLMITLHQRKLDKLKNLKQAYLNEMFV